MLAVIVLHTTSPLLMAYGKVPLADWIVGDVYNALTRFSVPVFVMLTGALLLGREYPLADFLRKRLARIIPPFLFWSLVYIGYRWYNEEFYFSGNLWANTRFVLHQLKTGSYYHLWYVYELIGLYLLIPILGKFVRHAKEAELRYFILIWLLTTVIATPYLERYSTAVDLHNFTGYAGYLVLGYYLSQKPLTSMLKRLIAALVAVCIVLIIALGTYHIQVSTHELSTYFYEPTGPFIVMYSAAVVLLARSVTITIPPGLQHTFTNASNYTLGIYFCHALVLNLFEWNDITYASYTPILSIPLIAVACFLLSWLFIWLMSKVPLMKNLVG